MTDRVVLAVVVEVALMGVTGDSNTESVRNAGRPHGIESSLGVTSNCGPFCRLRGSGNSRLYCLGTKSK